MTNTLTAPEGKNTIAFTIETAMAERDLPPREPASRPLPPASVTRKRQEAADLSAEALLAKQRALQAEEEAVQLQHNISMVQQEITGLEASIVNLEPMDFEAEGREAEARLKAGIGAANTSRQFNELWTVWKRSADLAKWKPEVLKEYRAQLATAKKNLAALTESK